MLFMLDLGQNDYYLQKKNGKKGLHNEILQDSYWLEITFKLLSISLCVQFLKKE